MRNNTQYIWFDLGYTLLKLKREEVFIKLLAEKGIKFSDKEIEEAFHLTDKLFMREYQGVLGSPKKTYMPWYFGIMFFSLKIKIDICSFFDTWEKAVKSPLDAWVPCPNTLPALKDLKESGYRLGVISNWDKRARSILDKHGLTGFFDTIVISSEVGIEKPEEDIFTIALKEAGISAEESLYVGDNFYDDAVGSRKVCMEVVILNRFENKGIEEISDCPILKDISQLKGYLEGKL